MPNKREFKKYVEALGASVIEELMIVYSNVDNADRQAISTSVGNLLEAIEQARANANVTFDRGPRSFDSLKDYSKAKKDFYCALFNKISSEFEKEVEDGLKVLNAQIPAEDKENLKKIANE